MVDTGLILLSASLRFQVLEVPECHQALITGMFYLVRISEVPEEEIFKICLDYWYATPYITSPSIPPHYIISCRLPVSSVLHSDRSHILLRSISTQVPSGPGPVHGRRAVPAIAAPHALEWAVATQAALRARALPRPRGHDFAHGQARGGACSLFNETSLLVYRWI